MTGFGSCSKPTINCVQEGRGSETSADINGKPVFERVRCVNRL